MNIKVAIDGPAGSGKSSISKLIAKRLNFTHIDTGAIFRAITYQAIKLGIDINDESKYLFLDNCDIIYKDSKVFLNGVDLSNLIRTDEINNKISTVSKIKYVREKALVYERKSASIGNIIMDGRDIGTVVLPDADVKIFLTAKPEERARRRLKEGNTNLTFDELLEEIVMRDKKDSERKIAPLKKASDAIEIDTTNLNIDDVCNMIISIIQKKVGM